MATGTLVSVSEYLHTDYEPDCDFVDGVLEDRNVGERSHAKAQKKLLFYLELRYHESGVFVLQEWRIQVAATRFRVPDLCVVLGPEPDEEVLTKPPFICIEILSPEDRVTRMQDKVDDYLTFGVPYVWVLDPIGKRAWVHTKAGVQEVRGELRTDNPEIVVPLVEIFS